MKHLCAVLSSIMLAAVLATPQLSYAGAQQNKMKTCNADADAKGFSGEGKGEQREARKAHGEGEARSCEEGQAGEGSRNHETGRRGSLAASRQIVRSEQTGRLSIGPFELEKYAGKGLTTEVAPGNGRG